LLQRRGRGSVPFRETFDLFFRERFKHCADSPDDATTLQRTQDAGHDDDYTADNDLDIVYNFDYIVNPSDDNVTANNFDQEAILLANNQQVKTSHSFNPYTCIVDTVLFIPYLTALNSNSFEKKKLIYLRRKN
jgi:hypothetical protein